MYTVVPMDNMRDRLSACCTLASFRTLRQSYEVAIIGEWVCHHMRPSAIVRARSADRRRPLQNILISKLRQCQTRTIPDRCHHLCCA